MTLILKAVPDVRTRATPVTYASSIVEDVNLSTVDGSAPSNVRNVVMVARAMQDDGYEVLWVEECSTTWSPRSGPAEARAEVVDGGIVAWGRTGYFSGIPMTPESNPDWGTPDDADEKRFAQVFPTTTKSQRTRLAPTRGKIEAGPAGTPPFWTRFVGTTATV